MGVVLLLALSVTVRAEQPRIVLGETARVRLQIATVGAPPDARLEMWASTGTVVDVRRESAEKYTAVYEAPPQRYPQVALVLATVHGSPTPERAWLALPLIARERLPVETRPGSRVEISIAGTVFGPVRADASGKARIPVKIPPGVRTAVVRVRDPFGNVNETSSDLRPPPFRRVRLLALRDRASWADADPVRLQVFAIAPDGQPASAADVSVVSDRGEVGKAQETSPGVFEVAFRAPERAGGFATVRATVFGDPDGETARIALLAGPPAQIRLRASPPQISGAGVVEIGADVLDARGNELPVEGMSLASDAFAIEQDGRVARLRVPAAHEGRREIRVLAKSGGVEGALAVPLRSGAPARATILVSDAGVREGQAMEALVELRDSGGNLVPGAALEVDADGARTDPPRELQDGLYSVRVRADFGDAPGPARLRVRAGDARETVRIGIVREEHADGISVGALLGGQSNLSRANAGALQAELSMHPGSRAFELLARAGLLQFAAAHDALTGVAEKGDLRGLSLTVGARASLPIRGPFSAHAAVLVGALRAYGSLAIAAGPAAGLTQGTAQWGPLATAAAGASLRLGTGRAIAEVQLSHAPARGDLAGNLGGLGVAFGYLFPVR